MMPAGVEVVSQGGHEVWVEKNSGMNSGFADDQYRQAGAKIIPTAKEIYDGAKMVMHVKEPAVVSDSAGPASAPATEKRPGQSPALRRATT